MNGTTTIGVMYDDADEDSGLRQEFFFQKPHVYRSRSKRRMDEHERWNEQIEALTDAILSFKAQNVAMTPTSVFHDLWLVRSKLL